MLRSVTSFYCLICMFICLQDCLASHILAIQLVNYDIFIHSCVGNSKVGLVMC